jgi:signal transduction histidine kinase
MDAVHSLPCSSEITDVKPLRVLFVDDEPGYLDLCKRQLSRLSDVSYVIDTASTVTEAVNSCLTTHYDCLLVDYQLPDGCGTDIVDRVRELFEHRADWQQVIPPAIIVTAEGGEHAATQAIRAGAADFMSKRDVTVAAMRRAIKHAVERSQLEASVRQRNVALEQANARMELANLQLEKKRREILKFYHTVSHEVKTPLAAAREFVALVKDGVAGEVSAEQHELLCLAMDSCDHIKNQFTELLELARIDCGKLTLNLQNAGLDYIVKMSMATVAESARLKNIRLNRPDPVCPDAVYCDQERIIQVISNLLVNAVKFTDDGGTVGMSLVSDEDEQRVRIQVTDTGCGIHENELDSIFERLYQVEHAGSDLSHSGLGLGLSISQEILKLHGSKLSVSSEPGVGSCFWFDLPLAAKQL